MEWMHAQQMLAGGTGPKHTGHSGTAPQRHGSFINRMDARADTTDFVSEGRQQMHCGRALNPWSPRCQSPSNSALCRSGGDTAHCSKLCVQLPARCSVALAGQSKGKRFRVRETMP
ncbi:hypothetical protein GUJ93_ZPchr0002g26539 [Zizania palustris]|uniref:Uncharacterized protein n=1 Tax=Zizania palustris TaxID=103762 RepID=A0A8J5SPW3_ZIZPA|nr:hypothetical protein GUJ93_ZPchr0002g26539 [Zizania palustris]